MTPITVIMAHFNNASMLQRQYDQFRSYPFHIRQNLEYIVVDDHSTVPPLPPAQPWDIPLRIGRQEVKVRWNQDSCRNWGVSKARNPMILLTDIDHLIPEETMADLILFAVQSKIAFRFSRVNDQTFDKFKPHPNTWFMSKALFDKVGGYDERFAGLYGTDGDFGARVKKIAKVELLPQHIIRVGREHTPDASTPREYGRKSEADSANIVRLIQERGTNPPRRGIFPINTIYDTEANYG